MGLLRAGHVAFMRAVSVVLHTACEAEHAMSTAAFTCSCSLMGTFHEALLYPAQCLSN